MKSPVSGNRHRPISGKPAASPPGPAPRPIPEVPPIAQWRANPGRERSFRARGDLRQPGRGPRPGRPLPYRGGAMPGVERISARFSGLRNWL